MREEIYDLARDYAADQEVIILCVRCKPPPAPHS
jgi:hypothetical protein